MYASGATIRITLSILLLAREVLKASSINLIMLAMLAVQ